MASDVDAVQPSTDATEPIAATLEDLVTGPVAKEQDNDTDEKPVNKSVKTPRKRQRPIERQPAKVEELKPVCTIANRRNAKREAKNLPVEEEKVMPATEKKETRGRKVEDY